MSHDPSEIILICWFAAHETFIIINGATILCNIINVFTVSFGQFVAFLLNKSINFFQKKKQNFLTPNFLQKNIVHKSNGPLLWYFYDALLVFLELDSPHSLSLCGKESTLRFPKTSRFMFLTRKKVIVWTGMMVSKQWQNVHFSVNCSFKNVARIFSSLFVLVILSLFVLSTSLC